MTYSPAADAIISSLRDCKTVAEVDGIGKKEARAVHLMALDPDLKSRAIHIKNMAAYRRKGIVELWG